MCDAMVIRFSEPKLRDPVAFIGILTVGLVGSILASLIGDEMKLPVVSGVTSPDYPLYTFISDCRPCPQIRVIAGSSPRPKKKRTDSPEAAAEKPAPKRMKHRDIVVVTSEFTPKSEHVSATADAVLDILESLGVKEIACLKGAAAPG